MKKALTSIHVLKVINLRVNGIVLCINASDLAIGVVLMQERKSTYEYRIILPTHEKELLIVIHALKIWITIHLSEKTFNIETNHESLKYLTTQPNLSRRQCRWVERLQQLNFGLVMHYIIHLSFRNGCINRED